MAHPTESRHPDDAMLLALVHGEPTRTDGDLPQHLAGCEQCARRLGEIRERDRAVGALLRDLDHVQPVRGFAAIRRGRRAPATRRGLAAAAAAVVIATAAAAAIPASPLYRWLQQRLASQAAPSDTPHVEPTPSRPAQATAGVALAAHDSLAVTIVRRQLTGALELSVGPGEITVRSRGGEVAYAVGDDHVTIDNRIPADAYLVTVPTTVRKVSIAAGGHVLFRLEDGRPTPPVPPGVTHIRIPLDGSPPTPIR